MEQSPVCRYAISAMQILLCLSKTYEKENRLFLTEKTINQLVYIGKGRGKLLKLSFLFKIFIIKAYK